MFNVSDVITNGTTVATVLAATSDFVVAKPDNGSEFALNASSARSWSKVVATAAPAGFTILHPYGLYRTDGTRVDGYADKARAIRRGKELFPRNGFVIVDATTAETTAFAGSRSR